MRRRRRNPAGQMLATAVGVMVGSTASYYGVLRTCLFQDKTAPETSAICKIGEGPLWALVVAGGVAGGAAGYYLTA